MEVGISQVIHQRNYRRARDRALAKLSQTFPDQYKEYLEEEKLKDEQEGKRWVAVDSTIRVTTNSIESYKDAIEGAVDPDNEGENTSYDGGEA